MRGSGYRFTGQIAPRAARETRTRPANYAIFFTYIIINGLQPILRDFSVIRAR